MVQLHLSLLSQWCGCTFLFSLTGAAVPFSFLSIPSLSRSQSISIMLPPSTSDHLLLSSQNILILFPTLSIFFSSTCWKLLFQKNLFLLCIFPKNHPHSSIIYFLLSCPKSTFPKPVWPLLMSVLCTPSHWLHLHGKTTHQPGESQQSSVWCWVTFPKIFSMPNHAYRVPFLERPPSMCVHVAASLDVHCTMVRRSVVFNTLSVGIELSLIGGLSFCF